MAQKPTETKNYIHHPQSKSEDVDVTQPGVVHIDDEPYFVDGVVAKFILELLDEIRTQKEEIKSQKQILSIMETFIGEFGEG